MINIRIIHVLYSFRPYYIKHLLFLGPSETPPRDEQLKQSYASAVKGTPVTHTQTPPKGPPVTPPIQLEGTSKVWHFLLLRYTFLE